MARTALEAQLEEITRDFVARIVAVIRNASLAEVAGYEPALRMRGPARPAPPIRPRPSADASASTGRGRRPRQSAETRAELSDRILDVLRRAPEPLGARAIASQVGLAADRLAVPLRELRDGGRVQKHGDKRATTYSAG